MHRKGNSHVTVALAAAIEAAPDTRRVRLLPLGTHKTRDGRLTLSIKDAAAAQSIIAASVALAGSQDIPVDYDHQTVYGAQPGIGGVAPAAAWIKASSLAFEDGPAGPGVYGDVEYTDKAAASVRAREYRYLSPVVRHDASGRITRLDLVALTNFPALDGLDRLAASFTPTQELSMDLSALAVRLGLPATATQAEVDAALTAQAAALSAAQADATALRTALGASDQAAALSAITTLKSSGDQLAALSLQNQTRLAVLEGERRAGIVDAHIAQGKVTPAQRDQFIALMATNEAQALSIMGSNPAIAGELLSKQAPGEKVTALSAEQKSVAAMLGVTEADYLATLQGDAA